MPMYWKTFTEADWVGFTEADWVGFREADAGGAGPGGAAPLALLDVRPFRRENIAVRGVAVEAIVPGGNHVSTGFRLGTRHLLSAAGASGYRAAVRDGNGCWTEWSRTVPAVLPNFTAGAAEASIGSAATADRGISSPGIVFPDLSAGSGRMLVRKTFVSGGFTEQARGAQWAAGRAAFAVVLDDLDEGQARRLQRFFRALQGPTRPFLFDFVDPRRGTRLTAAPTRHVVKFREPSVADGAFGATGTEMRFTLIEVGDNPEGGDV